MLYSERVGQRIREIQSTLEGLRKKYPDIDIDKLGAPVGQIDYEYKKAINTYKFQESNLETNLVIYKGMTGKKYAL